MLTFLPIGLGAGLVAAAVFASAATGPALSRLLLFALAFLPAFLAGLGWGWRSAAVAGLAGTAVIALMTNTLVGGVYFLTQGLPVAVLCYLASLHRDAGPPADAPQSAALVEWYPVGRIVLWAAVMAGAVGALSIAVVGLDLETIRVKLKGFLETEVVSQLRKMDGSALSASEIAAVVDLSIALLPAATTLFWLASLLFDLWLAARITLASGRPFRPWPDLADLSFPPWAPLLLAAAVAVTFADGIAGLMAGAWAFALLVAFLLKGLGMIHRLTRGWSMRVPALLGFYVLLFVTNVWGMLAIALYAIAEPFLPASMRPPPGLPPLSPPPMPPGAGT